MKVHTAMLLYAAMAVVAPLAVDSETAKNYTNGIDANGANKMKIKHSFAFPIFKFKLKLPFQNTSPNSLPQGQIGKVEEGDKSPSVSKEWKFSPDGTSAATPTSTIDIKDDSKKNNEDVDECDGSENKDTNEPPTETSKGFGDVFMEMMSVGKDLTLEKIEVLKDVLFLIDRIKEETDFAKDHSTADVGNLESENTETSTNDDNTSLGKHDFATIGSQASPDAKIDVWRSSIAQSEFRKLSKRHEITPEDLSNAIKLGDLKKFLEKKKKKKKKEDSKDNGGDEDEKDFDFDDSNEESGQLLKRADQTEPIFEANDFSKLKEKLGMSSKSNEDGDSDKEDTGSRKIKSHFKKPPNSKNDALLTTITTALTPETNASDEDCADKKPQPKYYPSLHPKGEEFPEGLYGGEPLLEEDDCDDENKDGKEKSYNVPMNLREKTKLQNPSLQVKRSIEVSQTDDIKFVKNDVELPRESRLVEDGGTPTTDVSNGPDYSDDEDDDDEGNEDESGKKKSKWSWSSIFGFGKNKKEEEPTSDDPEFASNWLLRKNFRSRKAKSRSSEITTTTVFNTPKPTETGNDNEEEEEDDPDCPKEKKERLRREKEEKLKKKKEALNKDKEALKKEKKLLKDKLKKVPKTSSKTAPKKFAPHYQNAPPNGIGLDAPALKSGEVPNGLSPVNSVTSEKRKNFLLLIPDQGDARLLNPEEFANVASEFDQALVVNVAYKTVQTAYKIAKNRHSGDIEDVADVEEIEDSAIRKHISKDKDSFGVVIKNRKAIDEAVSKFFGGKKHGGYVSDRKSDDDKVASEPEDGSSSHIKFVGYDSFEAHKATKTNDIGFEETIEKVFDSLKESGLINEILTMSIKDKLVRSSFMDLTIESLQNGEIPWDGLLMAIQAHGWDVDVEKLTFKKPEIGKILSKLVLEAIPVLLERGVLTRLDVIRKLSLSERLPDFKIPSDVEESVKEITEDDEVEHKSSNVKLEKGHSEKHHYTKNYNSTSDPVVEHHKEKNKQLEKQDHLRVYPGQDHEKDGHKVECSDSKQEHFEKLKDGELVHEEDSSCKDLHKHKENHHEENKGGDLNEERIEIDFGELQKEKLEQDYRLDANPDAIKSKRDKLALDKNLKSSTSLSKEHAKDHYESNRTLGGQRHSKERYAKEHHEQERHETAPGVEQYEKQKHYKEEHAKENHELGPQEHEQVVKEHGKAGNQQNKLVAADLAKESQLNVGENLQGEKPIQIRPAIPGQVLLSVVG
ncbi:hypothetical protein KGF57_002520 [Candida theae]|uniref:Uncharacterized protein n=1 Tax=Candida theae TaxID=1198502 RepID=A0AAD5FYW5_9ASCO|nr:uncharacterized protein KGF57_002520 [Candida theae]KAI5958675.1 hypothetical protein KGF57_002520 [Candida theae]